MSNHLEFAVFRILSRQQRKQFPEWDGRYYVCDLLEEIVDDPRITEADLDLKAYAKLLGPDAMARLLARHRHDSPKQSDELAEGKARKTTPRPISTPRPSASVLRLDDLKFTERPDGGVTITSPALSRTGKLLER